MKKTFDHLLGLSARNALAILAGYGITGVSVVQTGARPIGGKPLPPGALPRAERISLADDMRRQFALGVSDDGDDDDDTAPPSVRLTDDTAEDGMLTESRVVAVRDDGRLLIVARFRVGDPTPAADSAPRRP